MYHFFVSPQDICNNEIRIGGKDFNHIKNVLRLSQGEEISVSTGEDANEYRCIVSEFSQDEVICKLAFIKEAGVELPSKIYLFQGLPKADKMELIIQKCVELGVYEIVPVACKRCVVKLDDKKEKSKLVRWQGISEAAAKQSKRAIIPQIHQVLSMNEALQYAKECCEVRLIPYELAEGMKTTKELISGIKPGEAVAVFIGPEGGFEEDEVTKAKESAVLPITLGRRILRTETAGMVVLSWLGYQLENE